MLLSILRFVEHLKLYLKVNYEFRHFEFTLKKRLKVSGRNVNIKINPYNPTPPWN